MSPIRCQAGAYSKGAAGSGVESVLHCLLANRFNPWDEVGQLIALLHSKSAPVFLRITPVKVEESLNDFQLVFGQRSYLNERAYPMYELIPVILAGGLVTTNPESTEGRPWGQPLKKPAGAPLNLG